MIDAKPVVVEQKPFAAARLKPDEVPLVSRRCSFAVMPLTFEWEPLGVALLGLGKTQTGDFLSSEDVELLHDMHERVSPNQAVQRMRLRRIADIVVSP